MGPDPNSPGHDDAPAGETSAKVPGFRVANLLRMQQKLFTSGSRAANAPVDAGANGPAGPVPDKAAPDSAFGLQDYVEVILRRWPYLLIPVILVPVLAGVYTVFQPDEYEAVSRLLLTRSLVGQGVTDDMFLGGGYVTSTAFAQVAKLERVRKSAAKQMIAWAAGDQSVPLARLWSGKEAALPKWQLDRAGRIPTDARWTPEALSEQEMAFLGPGNEQEIVAFVSAVVAVVPDTQNVAVALAASDPNPLFAAGAADALATAMVEEFADLRSRRSSVAIIERHLQQNQLELERVNKKIADLRHQAAASSQAVEGFPLELERQYDLLKDHEFNFRSLEYMIEETQQKVELLRKRAKSAAEDVAPPEQLIQRLIDLELKLDEYAARYTEKHPRRQKVQEEIDRTQKAIEEYSKRRLKLGVGLRKPYYYYDPGVQLGLEEAKLVGLKAKTNHLAATIESVREEIEKSSAQERSLEYELNLTSRKVLQDTAVALRTRLHRAQLAEGIDSGPAGGAVEAVSAEVTSTGPHRWHTVVLGIMVGVLAGVLLALLAEKLDETVRLPAEMRAISGLPTLQVIPRFRKSLVIRPEETVSGIANVFAVLRNHIRYSSSGSPEKCVLVTSATSGEGKSLTALNLAISFAQEGNRICMVDADIQKGEKHALEVAVKLSWDPSVGLAGFLDGAAELDQILVPSVELPNLSFISSGGRAANPPRALRNERAADLFGALQEEFDVVIVDAPPVLPVVDAAILSSYSRAVIQVVRHGYTKRGELEEAVRRLRHVGAPIVGFILNCVPGSANGYYRRYYARQAGSG